MNGYVLITQDNRNIERADFPAELRSFLIQGCGIMRHDGSKIVYWPTTGRVAFFPAIAPNECVFGYVSERGDTPESTRIQLEKGPQIDGLGRIAELLTVDVNTAEILGVRSPGTYDALRTANAFAEQLRTMLVANYPGCEVLVRIVRMGETAFGVFCRNDGVRTMAHALAEAAWATPKNYLVLRDDVSHPAQDRT